MLTITTIEKVVPIILVIFIIILLIKYKENIKANKNLDSFIRRFLGILSGFSLIIYYIVEWSTNGVKITNLPLHLCFLSSAMCTILCFNKNKKLSHIVIYIGVLGGISSLLFPAIDLIWTSYRYYQFMTLHGLIIIIPIYFILVYDYLPNFLDSLKVFLYIQLLGISLGIFNETFNTEYMFVSFTSNFAARNSIISLIGNGTNYFPRLELIFIAIFLLWYLFLKGLKLILTINNNCSSNLHTNSFKI